MSLTLTNSIFRQREALAQILREPIEQMTNNCIPVWAHRASLENMFLVNLSRIPYCSYLYALNTDGIQICESIGRSGIQPGCLGRDHSQRPYMKEAVPAWGFLLSDAYTSLNQHRPSFTALQIVRTNDTVLGFIGVDFDLRDLPVTSGLYQESGDWRQATVEPSIRHLVFQHHNKSPMDQNLDQSLTILEELLTGYGVFQCQIHFSSSQAVIWQINDPFRYRLLDHSSLTMPDFLLSYPNHAYPNNAKIPQSNIMNILDNLKILRTSNANTYLRLASINIFNGMIGLTFSSDGSHYMPFDDFLRKNPGFWINSPIRKNQPIPA